MHIPSEDHLGFLIRFADDGTPRPRYLGRSSSREEKEDMEAAIPLPPSEHYEPTEEYSTAASQAFAAFKAKIEAAVEATRRKSKAKKAKKQQDQIEKMRGWCRSSKRTQCYLGLRPRVLREIQHPGSKDAASWEEEKQTEQEFELARGTSVLPLDVNQPAPCSFAGEPIFICVDVEANEKCHTQITEIGISILDTLDLIDIPPGKDGSNWMSRVRSRHFRIAELSYVINKDFVDGCPEDFQFGESELISIQQAAEIVDACFRPPYSGHIGFTSVKNVSGRGDSRCAAKPGADNNQERVHLTTVNNHQGMTKIIPLSDAGGVLISSDEVEICDESDPLPEYKTRDRNLIFVGHDAASDIAYLRKLGCKIFDSMKNNADGDSGKQTDFRPHFLEIVDTNILFRVLKREMQPSSLNKVLLDLDIIGWYLHNAGNDARYTMEAMLAITVRSRLLLDKTSFESRDQAKGDEMEITIDKHESAWKAEVERRVAKGAAETEARVRGECASWDIALGLHMDGLVDDDVDGGSANGIHF